MSAPVTFCPAPTFITVAEVAGVGPPPVLVLPLGVGVLFAGVELPPPQPEMDNRIASKLAGKAPRCK